MNRSRLHGFWWLSLSAAAMVQVACGPDADLSLSGETAAAPSELNAGDVRLRLMAANISSGNYQSYDPGEGIRIFQGTHPDVVMIQEFNYGTNSAADIRSFVDTAFGTGFQYFREAGAQIPNGVISRYPILASGEWDDPRVSNRDFAWARIDIPGPTNLWAISVHLLTTSTTERDLEAQSLVSFIQQNVPAGDYLAIAGDYNTSSRTEACITDLSSKVVTSGPYPADRNGNPYTNASRAKPYDWVLVSSGLDARKAAVVLGSSSFANGLVADTRVYSPISEISPALSTDSGAINMQHMGVIRDFGVPSDTAAASVTVASPNGGESWTAGTAYPITWTSSNVSAVRLDYSLDNGATWTAITSSTPAAAGSYSWTAPGTPSTQALVKVSDTGSAAADTSNAVFTISAVPVPTVTVTSPNGGESWAAGSAHPITWTSSNVSAVRIDSSLDNGATWTAITASTSASAGSYSWTVPGTASTQALVKVSDTGSAAADTSNAAFSITSGGGGSGVVFINEILANEPGSDVNGEFVELVNGTSSAVDLSGWTVSDGTQVRHTFASGTSLAQGAAIAVFGGASGIPAGLTNAVAASTGSLNLSNSGDTVTVKNASGTTVDTYTYSSALSGTDGVSMNRNPDASSSGSFALHTSLSSLSNSPGKRADGSDFTSGGGGGSTSISAETESNDTAATANAPLGNGKNVSGAISTTTDADWFKLTVKTTGTLTLSVSMPGSADLDWYLYSASNTSNYVARGYTTNNPELGSYSATAGDYYVKVVGYSGATSSYTLNVSAAAGVIDP